MVFLSSSELDEVVLEENWYFRFTVTGMLQLSRYLKKRHMFDHMDFACVCYLKHCSSSACQLLPNDTVEAADLLIGMDSVVFAGEVLQATRSTISALYRRS